MVDPPERPVETKARWRARLRAELAHRSNFEHLTESGWRLLLRNRKVTSDNRDTVLTLDWPHFCTGASRACGGEYGWCYTLSGHLASEAHDQKVAMVDLAARRAPEEFARKVAAEVKRAVEKGRLSYPNLRYSGSGEVAEAHLEALRGIRDLGVSLWGFTRRVVVAEGLRSTGAHVLVSCDSSTPIRLVHDAAERGFELAYISTGVEDLPPEGTRVTFPVHRVGVVREVVDHPSVCPKVVDEFLHGVRRSQWCQLSCHRCHNSRRA